jgi:hypothetical protein
LNRLVAARADGKARANSDHAFANYLISYLQTLGDFDKSITATTQTNRDAKHAILCPYGINKLLPLTGYNRSLGHY